MVEENQNPLRDSSQFECVSSTERLDGPINTRISLQRRDEQNKQLLDNMAKLRELEKEKRQLEEVVDSYRKRE